MFDITLILLQTFQTKKVENNTANVAWYAFSGSARTGIRTPVIGLEGRDDIQTTLYGQFPRAGISPISITVVLHIYDNEVACES